MVALNAWWREAARISSANSFLVAAWLASVGLPAGFAADPIDKEAAAAVQLRERYRVAPATTRV